MKGPPCGNGRRKIIMFYLTQSMGATAATEAAGNKHKIFGSVEIGGLTVSFEAMLYPDLNLALELHVVEGGRPIEAYTTLTVRGRHHDPLQGDEILVKTCSENELVREPMLASGYFVDTGKRVHMDYAQFEVWQIAPAFVRAFIVEFPMFAPPLVYLCPPKAYFVETSTSNSSAVMEVRRGEPAHLQQAMDTPVAAAHAADSLNKSLGVSSFELEAMLNGLSLGWDAPEVDPELVRLIRQDS